MPVKAAIGATKALASSTARSSTAVCSSVGSFVAQDGTLKARPSPASRQRPAAIRGKQSSREQRKWSPVQAACVALLVLCLLLATGLLGYLLFFRHADKASGAHQREADQFNITTDSDTTTEPRMIHLPDVGGAEAADAGDRNVVALNGSYEANAQSGYESPS
ncbi:hypothetical protein MRX96_035976 [Rhipicephalus microplus]